MTVTIFLVKHYSSITLPVVHGGLFPLCSLPSNLDGSFWLSWLIHCGRSNQCGFWVRSRKHTHFYHALSGCSFLELCIRDVRKLEQPMKRLPRRGNQGPWPTSCLSFQPTAAPAMWVSHLESWLAGSRLRCPSNVAWRRDELSPWTLLK